MKENEENKNKEKLKKEEKEFKTYNYYLSVVIIAILVTTIGVTSYASADDGESNENNYEGPRYRMEQGQEMKSALENNDYDAWKQALGDRFPADKINEQTFSKLVESFKLRQAGDFEQSRVIMEELGISGPKGMHGEKKFNLENHQAMMEALDKADYDTWKQLIVDSPMAEKITEENFAKFADAHNLMKQGKFEEARQIREDLGLQRSGNKMMERVGGKHQFVK